MKSLGKSQMLFAVSVSLVAYAFAMAGCGEKKSPDTDTKAASLAAAQTLAGTWSSEPQDVKAGQQNLYMLTFNKKKLTLRAACTIGQKDRTPPTNAVAETTNDFIVEAKNIKFEANQTKKSGEAPDDCAVSLAKGNVKFSVDGDKLTMGLNIDGSAATDAKAAGIVFKKLTPDEMQAKERDMFSKSTAGIAAAAAKAADPAAAAKDAGAKTDAPTIAGLVGTWVLQAEDAKVKAKLGTQLTKTNFDYIRFSDKKNVFIERYVCRYEVITTDKSNSDLLAIKPIGFRMKSDHLPDVSDDPTQFSMKDFEKGAIPFEATAADSSIKILEAIGTRTAQGSLAEKTKLSEDDKALTDCTLSYTLNQKLNFDLSPDGKTLSLYDSTNKDSRRDFHRFDKSNADDMKIAEMIRKYTKEEKAAETKVVKKDEKKPEANTCKDDDDDCDETTATEAVDAAKKDLALTSTTTTTTTTSGKVDAAVTAATEDAAKAVAKTKEAADKAVVAVAPVAAAAADEASKALASAAAGMQRAATRIADQAAADAAKTPPAKVDAAKPPVAPAPKVDAAKAPVAPAPKVDAAKAPEAPAIAPGAKSNTTTTPNTSKSVTPAATDDKPLVLLAPGAPLPDSVTTVPPRSRN